MATIGRVPPDNRRAHSAGDDPLRSVELPGSRHSIFAKRPLLLIPRPVRTHRKAGVTRRLRTGAAKIAVWLSPTSAFPRAVALQRWLVSGCHRRADHRHERSRVARRAGQPRINDLAPPTRRPPASGSTCPASLAVACESASGCSGSPPRACTGCRSTTRP